MLKIFLDLKIDHLGTSPSPRPPFSNEAKVPGHAAQRWLDHPPGVKSIGLGWVKAYIVRLVEN